MSHRAAMQIQILERLGLPLLSAVGSVSLRAGEGADMRRDAARLAELIARTVQMSVTLSDSMDIRDDRGQADGLRLALAGIAAPLMAGTYEMSGRLPADGDATRLAGVMAAVLAFADNFTPAADTSARLAAMDPATAPIFDESQIHVQALFVMVPVVQAVGVYAFGRAEKKLVQDVAATIQSRAAELCRTLTGAETDGPTRKRMELAAARALGLLYAQSHAMETNRVMLMDDAARQSMVQPGGLVSMDGVWSAFDRGVEMLALTVGAILPNTDESGGSAGRTPVRTAPEARVAPVIAPVIAASAPAADPAPASAEGDANPMMFFSRKTSGGEQGG